jgi:hypothetical protein
MACSLLQYLLLVTSIVSLVTGTPTPASLAPRACSTVGSANINILDKNAPDTKTNGQVFALRRTGGRDSNTLKSVVSFTYIPQGATGCMLQIDLPAQPSRTSPDGLASGTGTQSDVWLLKKPAGTGGPNPWNPPSIYGYTWNSPPEKSQFVSTTFFPPGKPTDPYKTFLWSGTCDPTMSFQFELSDWQQGSGDVRFYNHLGGKEGLVNFGFSMIYNC